MSSTRFGSRSTAVEVSDGVDLSQREAIVTGANTGIGLETARVLALRGARVVMACRDLEKGSSARERVLAAHPELDPERLELKPLDLGSLASVRSFAQDVLATARPLHLLINNAGVMLPDRRETHDGFEAHLGVNHLGHFLLTQLLLERVLASAPARVVNLSSDALHFHSLTGELEDLNWEKRRFSGWRSYGDSKLMNVLFTRELSRRVKGSGVVSHAVHPGIVRTELARDQPWWMHAIGVVMLPMSKDVARGAATTLYAATAPDLADEGGRYLADCGPGREAKLGQDTGVATRLWARSLELVGLPVST